MPGSDELRARRSTARRLLLRHGGAVVRGGRSGAIGARPEQQPIGRVASRGLSGWPILGWGFALVKRGPGGRSARARSPGWQVACRTGPRRQPGHARLTSSLADATSAAIAWPVEARRAGLEACRLDLDPYSRRFGGSPRPPSRCLCPAACSSSVHTRRLRSRPRTSSSPTKATSGGRSSSSLQVDSAR
jgi:hypothetical protein